MRARPVFASPRPPPSGSAGGAWGTSIMTRDDLIRSGRAIPHPTFPESKTDVSHELQSAEDVRGVLELFRARDDRAIAREASHAARTGKGTG